MGVGRGVGVGAAGAARPSLEDCKAFDVHYPFGSAVPASDACLIFAPY